MNSSPFGARLPHINLKVVAARRDACLNANIPIGGPHAGETGNQSWTGCPSPKYLNDHLLKGTGARIVCPSAVMSRALLCEGKSTLALI